MVHNLLKSKNLPGWLWGEAVVMAVYLLNWSPTKSMIDKTPFEAWYGKKPGVQHLRTFGCVDHVKDTSLNLKKLEDRSRPMIFIGYELGSKVYRTYGPITKKVHVSRDVVFSEQEQWDWSKGGERGEDADNNGPFSVEMEYSTETWVVAIAYADAGSPEVGSSPGSPLPPPRSPTPIPLVADEVGG
jgi:hypothetical protein